MSMSHHRSLHLSNSQRQHLERLIHSGAAPARTQTKARILLASDRSQGATRSDGEIAQALLCSRGTIVTTRRRFLDEGLEAALYDKPRPGAKPKITGEVEAQLVMLACSAPPEGYARWTLRLLADQLVHLELVESISAVAVHYRLKKTNLSLGR
jgi:putative transposase